MTAPLRQSALIDMDHSYVDVYLYTLEMDDFAMARITSSNLWFTVTNSAANVLNELLAKRSLKLRHHVDEIVKNRLKILMRLEMLIRIKKITMIKRQQ